LINSVAYWLALAIAAACGLVPFLLVPIPAIDPYQLLLVPAIVGAILRWAMLQRWRTRLRILGWAATGAGLALSTSTIVGHFPPYTAFRVPIPNIVGPVFHLDGEAAYDAGMYELWCEAWLALALITIGLFFVVKRGLSMRRSYR